MTHMLLSHLLSHGWHVWPEFHYYYADHSRGGWIEWLARKSATCSVQLRHGNAYLNYCTK